MTPSDEGSASPTPGRSEHAGPDVPGEDRRESYRGDVDQAGYREDLSSDGYRVADALDEETGDDAPDSG